MYMACISLLSLVNIALCYLFLQELEEDPEFQRVIKTGYANRPMLAVRFNFLYPHVQFYLAITIKLKPMHLYTLH